MLNFKIIIGFALFGLLVSLIGGMAGAVPLGTVMLRSLLGVLAFAGLGAGVSWLIKKYLPDLDRPLSAGTESAGSSESETGNAVDIVLPEADCTIRGQVVDQMGEAAGGSVKMRASGSAFEGGTMPDADGRFAFKVPAGSYRVSAHSTVRRWGEEIGRTDVSVGKESRSADVSVVVDAG